MAGPLVGGRSRIVGGALGEEERLAEHALHLLGRRTLGFESDDLLLELPVALVHALEGDGRPLEELFDLFGPVTAEGFPQLRVPEIMRGHVHSPILTINDPMRVDPATVRGQQCNIALLMICIPKNTTIGEMSIIPTVGMIRRTGPITGSVSW